MLQSLAHRWLTTLRRLAYRCLNILQLRMLILLRRHHSETTDSLNQGSHPLNGTSINSSLRLHRITILFLHLHSLGKGRFQSGQISRNQSKGSTTRHTILAMAEHQMSSQLLFPSRCSAILS